MKALRCSDLFQIVSTLPLGMSSLEFQDAVVVVVDASAGSGLSCSRLFRKRGAKFLLNYPPDRTNSRPEGNIQVCEPKRRDGFADKFI